MSVVESYDPIARDYCEKSVSSDRRATRARFGEYLQDDDLIFDAGCGSGIDTRAFLELGFNVFALDGSKEMVKFATHYTGVPVEHLTFEEMEFDEQFDAIWASYSLVHYSAAELRRIIPKFIKSLRNGGYWYMSFIYGLNERPDASIPFYPKTEATLRQHLRHFLQLEEKEMWVTSGTKRDGNPAEFLHCIVQKKDFQVFNLN